MYTEQPKLFAAVRSSDFTSAALAATDVRFDGASITRAKPSRILGHFHYFARQFVPQDAWVCIDRVPPSKSVKIASTNPDSMNSNQGLSTGRHWAWNHDGEKFARSIQQNSSHKRIPRRNVSKKVARIGPAILRVEF
jgi:hypothetical protein